MIDLASQLTALTTNQLLIAGVGTTLVAYAVMQGKSLVATLKTFGGNQVFSTLTARSNGTTITRLTQLVARHRIHASGASYSVAEDNALTIGYGSGIARWQGVWIWYNLSIDANAKTWNVMEVLELTFLTRDRRVIERFVREALDSSNQDRDTINVHHRANNCWDAVTRKKRPVGTVFANAGMKAEIIAKVGWFLANEDWYVRRGLNYKLVILLHGPPGTGKTSLIQAVASHFNRDLYCIDSLMALGPEIGRFANGILAIEDIDTLGALKRDVEPADDGLEDQRPVERHRTMAFDPSANPKLLLHGVLNTLDGLATPHGLITIITTNHIAALDPAMVRPCRIDLQLEVTALDYDAFAEMFGSHFDGKLPAVSRSDYVAQTGARLQEVFMGARGADEASAAVRKLCGHFLEAA